MWRDPPQQCVVQDVLVEIGKAVGALGEENSNLVRLEGPLSSANDLQVVLRQIHLRVYKIHGIHDLQGLDSTQEDQMHLVE